MAGRLCKVFALSLVLLFLLSAVALADPIPGDTSLDPIESTDPDAYLQLTQGLDTYEQLTFDQWYAALPDYNGPLSSDKFDASVLRGKDFARNGQAIGQAVAAMKKAQLSESDDPALALWKKAHLTKPIPIYNFDGTIYGYLYGVVHGKKLIGHMVVGTSAKAPPILEYSTGAGEYQKFAGAEKIYFGRANGFLLLRGGVLQNADEKDIVYRQSDLSALLSANEPAVDTQAALDAAWLDFEEAADAALQAALARPVGHYVPLDTSDYTYMWQNSCHAVARSMYVDAIARRVEPGFFGYGRPHSVKNALWFWNHCPQGAPTWEIINDLQLFLTTYRSTTAIAFNVQFRDSGDGSGTTAAQVFAALQSRINAGWPALVGYGIPGGGHVMMGVGYTDDNFYICRDTYTEDGSPFSSYFAFAGDRTWYCIWATWNASTWGTQTLRKTSSGTDVRRLQRFLNELFYTCAVDGNFGTGTENAVKAFQSDNGLSADGVVGPATYAKMKVAHIMRYDDYTASWRDLSTGKKGDDVAQVQMRLIRRQYLPGLANSDWSAADGIFGSQTRAAVIAFQADHGLPQTGTVSTLTFQALTN